MKNQRRNDDERRLWVLNDEGLYNMQRGSRQSVRAFVRENRAMIDEHIDAALAPPKPKAWWEYRA